MTVEKMRDVLKTYPFQSKDGEDRLFLARFELPKFGEDFQLGKGAWRALALSPGEEAPPDQPDDQPFGFIHFLAGFPIDTVEMLVLVGEFSSLPTKDGEAKVNVQDGAGKCFAPVWKGGSQIFQWPDKEKLLLNKTALKQYGSLFFAENLPGEPEPKKAHWWFRKELAALDTKFPVPGEFVGLGVRMMPGEFWGHQKSSPFIYSGNFLDTVFLTSAVIVEVLDEDTPAYMVQWRKDLFKACSSDFAEYKVDDRVTLLKDAATEKKSQLWKDDDMMPECDKEVWQIIPVTFYGYEKPE